MGFYDYSVPNSKGEEVSMKDFEGKVVLVVNTATGCGFTPQYEDIESIYEEFHAFGVDVAFVQHHLADGADAHDGTVLHQVAGILFQAVVIQVMVSAIVHDAGTEGGRRRQQKDRNE